MADFFSKTIAQVQSELKVDAKTGLSSDEAKVRIQKYGENKLNEKPKKTMIARFIEQMKDVMIIILLVAALISFGLSIYHTSIGESGDWVEPIVIILIVIVNGVLGVVQESRAEAALEALKKMTSPVSKVKRDGNIISLSSSELTVGDVVILEAGDWIPADCRIIQSASLKSDEAALTGESLPSDKDADFIAKEDAPLGDRHNMLYSGCSVSYGRGEAIVVSTGMKTEMGKIAAMLEGEKEGPTPLQQKLAQLGKYLGFLALGICAVIFIIGIIDNLGIMEMFMTAVSLAVAAIPEGLPAIVTIVLAIGVQRMVTKNAIIRRLPAVETLGSTSVICSDKTGTLTQNRMTLLKVFADGDIINLDDEIPESAKRLIELGTLCTDGKVSIESGEEKHIGDPTETAIVAAALRYGIEKDDIENRFPRVSEIPFDSDRKLMTTIHKIGDKIVAIVKGAPDILLSRCIEGDTQKAAEANTSLGKEALRVLAVGYKELDSIPENPKPEEIESDLTFIGLVGMIDPPRPEVKDSIMECYQAGIQTIMITGDHIATATAIAKQLNILENEEQAISGAELAAMSDDELFKNIRKYRVYARVTPTDKIRIVKTWQKAGEIVAMTGDGVNDAPALKAADIGCAMGITGTDVAKGAADMTLTDDNFATIVTAVKEGRGIYDNIKKAVHFLLSCNLGEIVTVFAAMLLWKATPLLPIQLLWINLVTDSLPALALGMEPVEFDIMKRKPRKKEESIFAHGVGISAIWQGLMVGIITLVAFFVGWKMSGNADPNNNALAETMAFSVLAISQLIHAFNVRSGHSLFKVGFFSNKNMVKAFFASLALTLVVLFVPFMQDIFKVSYMNLQEWLVVIGLSLVPLVLVEISKIFTDRSVKD